MMRSTLPRLTLVLGGARSGKSKYAEEMIGETPPPWLYLATGEALDDEMRERIEHHRSRRDTRWRTLDAPRDLAGTLAKAGGDGCPILIDCLTLWLSNTLLADGDVAQASEGLIAALAAASGPVVAVSNEVGFGLVPDTPLGRTFRDAQGRLNQRVAAMADRVVLVVAGLPLILK